MLQTNDITLFSRTQLCHARFLIIEGIVSASFYEVNIMLTIY